MPPVGAGVEDGQGRGAPLLSCVIVNATPAATASPDEVMRPATTTRPPPHATPATRPPPHARHMRVLLSPPLPPPPPPP
eukprot:6865737-Prymnesium_polylepis.1